MHGVYRFTEFRVEPMAVLHVEQRDRVIFVCPKDEYFILWTYNKQIFENCSNPGENGNAVNILYRCSFKDPYNTPSTKTTDLSEMSLWSPLFPSDPLSRSLPGIPATASTSMPYRRPRPSMQQILPRNSRDTTKRSTSLEEGETFTLLINEFAWSTGTPSFQRNRPVYFTAQPKICKEENMRLIMVQGELPSSKDDYSPRSELAQKELGAVRQTLQDCSNREKCRRYAFDDYTSGKLGFSLLLSQILFPLTLLLH
nr:hypothetical protein HmN_000037000 [Hymenolepis microstoma]